MTHSSFSFHCIFFFFFLQLVQCWEKKIFPYCICFFFFFKSMIQDPCRVTPLHRFHANGVTNQLTGLQSLPRSGGSGAQQTWPSDLRVSPQPHPSFTQAGAWFAQALGHSGKNHDDSKKIIIKKKRKGTWRLWSYAVYMQFLWIASRGAGQGKGGRGGVGGRGGGEGKAGGVGA